jgi:hypothetical protein
VTLLPLLPQVILEEFGKFINATVGADMNQRNQYYGIIFDEINKLTDAGKPIKVSLLSSSISACARVRACVRPCVRACVCVCVHFSACMAFAQVSYIISRCSLHGMRHNSRYIPSWTNTSLQGTLASAHADCLSCLHHQINIVSWIGLTNWARDYTL